MFKLAPAYCVSQMTAAVYRSYDRVFHSTVLLISVTLQYAPSCVDIDNHVMFSPIMTSSLHDDVADLQLQCSERIKIALNM